MSRAISEQEAKLLARVLVLGANDMISQAQIDSINSLEVTATCSCGCGTVWFGPAGESTNGHNLAEARASINAQPVDVIVWSQQDAIVGLEIVGYGQMGLPELHTVKSFGNA